MKDENKILDLLERAKHGSQPAYSNLFKQFQKDIDTSAEKFYSKHKYLNLDDLIFEAYAKFEGAVNNYNKNKDASFRIYLDKVCKNAFLNILNKEVKNHKKRQNYGTEQNEEDKKDNDELINNIVDKETVTELLTSLSDIENKVIQLAIENKMKIPKVVKELNKSRDQEKKLKIDEVKKIKEDAKFKMLYKSLYGDLYSSN